MFVRLKKFLIGNPLETTALQEQRLSKKAALAVFASDSLSSVAYATEAMMLALMGASVVVLSLTVPASIVIVGLLVVLVISYSQSIYAYPTGGGDYTVAKHNLGIIPGLTAGAALLFDYVLTVAVSVTAGIAAITSAVPGLHEHRLGLVLLAIFLILLTNLRGVRESANVFAFPVYAFITMAFALVFIGLIRYFTGNLETPPAAPASPELGSLAFFLLLRAFASGCTALTGIEAIANGVKAFRNPISRNASITLFTLAVILGSLFLGITVLIHLAGITPVEGETVLSQLARQVFGSSTVYYIFQITTMGVLILAANTSFSGFPRLASVMAQDRFLPRQLANMGDRLVFSNGVLILALAASLLVILFRAEVHALIPLYMIGVFISFTLCQAGLVVHWMKTDISGRHARMALNAVGASLTGLALLVVAWFKFADGAWVVIVVIPSMVWIFNRIRRHYQMLRGQVSLASYEKDRPFKHTVIMPVSGINKVVLTALQYAQSISKDVIAVLVNVENLDAEKLSRDWNQRAPDVPLVILESPYRSVLSPFLTLVEDIQKFRNDDIVTVLLPEFVSARWWEHLLHNQTGLLIKAALLFKPKIVVTSVPYHIHT
ncbi:MAG: APC family permease [Acidobacteriota bacterium]